MSTRPKTTMAARAAARRAKTTISTTPTTARVMGPNAAVCFTTTATMSGAPDAGTVNAADSCSGGAASAASCSLLRRRRASASVSTRADESAQLHSTTSTRASAADESDATQSWLLSDDAGGEVGVERHRHNDRAVSGEVERGRREASGRGRGHRADAAGE